MWAIRYAMRRTLAWASSVTGLVAVGPDSQAARPARPYLGLSYLPGAVELPVSETALVGAPVAYSLDFGAVSGPTARVAVAVADEVVVGSGYGDGSAARDAFLARLQALYLDADGWISFAGAGATALTVTTSAGWAPPRVAALQTVTATPTTVEDIVVRAAPFRLPVRLQLYGDPATDTPSPSPAWAGLQAMAKLRHAAYDGDPEASDARPPVLLAASALDVASVAAGPRLEPRVYLDLIVVAPGGSRHALTGLAGVAVTVRPAL